MSRSHGLSELFRSLDPEEVLLPAVTNATVHAAEQRWPLLKAAPPRKWDLPPPELSAQEKQRWIAHEKPATGVHKPALSLPQSGDKLAQSLSKMSRPQAKATPVGLGTTAVKSAVRSAAEIFSPSPPQETGASLPSAGSPGRGTLFSSLSVGASMGGAGEAPATGDSLRNVFSRLEATEDVAVKPAVKRPSFFKRLGRR